MFRNFPKNLYFFPTKLQAIGQQFATFYINCLLLSLSFYFSLTNVIVFTFCLITEVWLDDNMRQLPNSIEKLPLID